MTGHTSERFGAEIGSFGADEAERVLRSRLPDMLSTQSPEIFEFEANISHALLKTTYTLTIFLPRRHVSQSVGQKPLSTGDIRVNVGQNVVVPCDGGHCRSNSLLSRSNSLLTKLFP
jgi:hypothetical protein